MQDYTKERIVAIVRLGVMLISAVLGGIGLTGDVDALFTIALCAIALVSAVFNWWKNNNLTNAANMAQGFLDEIKRGQDA